MPRRALEPLQSLFVAAFSIGVGLLIPLVFDWHRPAHAMTWLRLGLGVIALLVATVAAVLQARRP